MFENFLNPEKELSPTEVLNNLMKKEHINFTTALNMAQIRILCKSYYFKLKKEKPELTAWELMNTTLEYYKELKTSYKGKRADDIIKGISEIKDDFLKSELDKERDKRTQ